MQSACSSWEKHTMPFSPQAAIVLMFGLLTPKMSQPSTFQAYPMQILFYSQSDHAYAWRP